MNLPEPEVLYIKLLLGDSSVLPSLVALAPDDWRVQEQYPFSSMWETLDKHAAHNAFILLHQMRPKHAEAAKYLSLFYADFEQWQQAIEVAKEYLLLESDLAKGHDHLGEILLMAGEFEKAERSFRQAISEKPDLFSAYNGIACSYFYRNRWQQGLAALYEGMATSKDEKTTGVFEQAIGWSLLVSGQSDTAKNILLSKASDGMRHSRTLSHLSFEQQNWRGPLEAATQMHSQPQTSQWAKRWSNMLGSISLAYLGQMEQAKKRIHELPTQGVHPAISKDRIFAQGFIAMHKGKFDEAHAHFGNKWVLNHGSLYDPGRGRPQAGFELFALKAKFMSAQVYRRAGNLTEAKRIFAQLARTYRRGIAAVAIRQQAIEMLAENV